MYIEIMLNYFLDVLLLQACEDVSISAFCNEHVDDSSYGKFVRKWFIFEWSVYINNIFLGRP